MAPADAWYCAERAAFVRTPVDDVVKSLAHSASSEGWHVEVEQHAEWAKSVDLLQSRLDFESRNHLHLLHDALASPSLSPFTDIVLEFNFRRRGLRLDAVLFAPGLLVVIEFKRTRLGSADRDQVTNYCINLLEFHEETRRLCTMDDVVMVPVLALTVGVQDLTRDPQRRFHSPPWSSIAFQPIQCDARGLRGALEEALAMRRSESAVDCATWLKSRFAPSSTILDAAISLYGRHDVSAIQEHAVPAKRIEDCTAEVRSQIADAKRVGRNRIIFVSGTPGSGKTLVGLNLAFDPELRDDAVFVTGNAPLVDVLSEALKQSYRGLTNRSRRSVPTGYPRDGVQHLVKNATFKIVKAHAFLGERGRQTDASDGSIIVFDEAQRTYEKGRIVGGHPLRDHEADLILESLGSSYPPGCVVVALLGHNQAINRGERGAIAWFEAAERRDWDYAIADSTLALAEFADHHHWRRHPLRRSIQFGHLSHSMRFYRNKGIEEWAHAVLENQSGQARDLAATLTEEGHPLLVTRDLGAAKAWARDKQVGEERIGLIASAQGRRLVAEGLHVDQKPPIGHWMLAPGDDIRSSNMLETVQNQYQIQGLELDYTVIGWDVDLRREDGEWNAFKIRGSKWQRDSALDIAKNGYRVLLTRARKGMVIYVPRGDLSGRDDTREPGFYDRVAAFLDECGAQSLD